MNRAIAAQRLHNQGITGPQRRSPADVVEWLGAIQAQEDFPAKWALALRTRRMPTSADIDHLLDEGRILRTHVMRPTWHFVPASDIRWMLELTKDRVRRGLAFGNRHYEIDAALCTRACHAIERALGGGACLTRAELGGHLARARIIATGIRLALLTIAAELEGVICSGPRRGKQMTYALFETRVRAATRLSRDEALGELTKRYFRSHGPATVRDFMWWSGLTTADAKRGLAINRARSELIDGLTYWTLGARRTAATSAGVHLLPIYDEYLVAHRDLAAVPRAAGSFGRLQQAVVAGGEVVGTWQAVRDGGQHVLKITTVRRLSAKERSALRETTDRYERFSE